MAAHAAGIFGEFDRDLFDIEQRDPGMMQQRLAGRRQRHSLGLPLEQADVESGLEIIHPLGDGGRGNALAHRRAREIPFLAHRDEQPQRGEIDPPQQRAFGGAEVARRYGKSGSAVCKDI